jgi:hypothetical protein
MVAPVYVTGRQVDARARFRLGTLSSVSVLPESGTLTVSVNGADVKAVPVGAAYALRVTELAASGLERRRNRGASQAPGRLLRGRSR